MSDLLPCPKCKEQPELKQKETEIQGVDFLYKYDCCGFGNCWNATKDYCEDDWNYDQEVRDGYIEDLEKRLSKMSGMIISNVDSWKDDHAMIHTIETKSDLYTLAKAEQKALGKK